MPLFGTPDFGAAAGIGCFVLIIWAVVFVFVGFGLVLAARSLGSESAKRKTFGCLLLLTCGLVPLSCCLGPSQLVRLTHGNYPIGSYPTGKVSEGMTADEVTAVLGTPHERDEQDGRKSWFYWIDAFGISWFGVDFGPDGRVKYTYGN
jgi:hypothetical protein